jgi:hypothetical protein
MWANGIFGLDAGWLVRRSIFIVGSEGGVGDSSAQGLGGVKCETI